VKNKKTLTETIYRRLAEEGKTAADVLNEYRIGRPALLKLGQSLGIELRKTKGGGAFHKEKKQQVSTGKKFSASPAAVEKALQAIERKKEIKK